jgi:N utilization substance protein A
MAVTEFSLALNQVATERGIPVESVVDSIKTALATAYKKDRKEHGEEDVDIEEIEIDLDRTNGEVRILKDGKDVTPSGFGRIAAQTAKQVILQKIRETEKDVILTEFKEKIGEIVNGQVFRISNGVLTMDLGKSHAQGIMPQSEQVENENYRVNQRLKVLIKDVRQTAKGTEIIVSRSDPEFVKQLFKQEVPEIASGTVVIEAIAREAGSRTKMAVSSSDEKIDAVGSCVGQKGVRVQSIISELFGEKIDIIPFSSIQEKFIASSLSPAKVSDVELDEEENRATVIVPEDQQSLAIGKEGQNARLANKLTKWKIDIKGVSGLFISDTGEAETTDQAEKKVIGVWDSEIKKSEESKDEEGDESVEVGDEAEETVDKEPEEVSDEVVEDAGEEKADDESKSEEVDDKDQETEGEDTEKEEKEEKKGETKETEENKDSGSEPEEKKEKSTKEGKTEEKEEDTSEAEE